MKKIINNKKYISSQTDLMKEWCFEKNKGKNPTNILIDSDEVVWWKCSKGHLWEASVKERINGRKCIVCQTKEVITGFNDIKTLAPHLIAEWDYEKNTDLDPEKTACCSNKKAWWKCSKGHSWFSVISSRFYGTGCPYCTNRKVLVGYNDLQTVNPSLSAEWNKKKNGKLTPQNYTANSNQKVWWTCKYGHEWLATIESRNNRKYGCPYCAGKRVIKGVNDLKTMNPKLAKQWNKKKNGKLTPEDVSYQSHKKVWWKCSEDHEWQAEIAARQRGNGCPICDNKVIVYGINDLETINPELAIEWAKNRNGDLTPRDVSAGSNKRVWWKCSEGHEWIASINDRNRGKGCPTCANKKIVKGYNDLKTVNPRLAKEWNFKRNGKLKPTHVSCNSNRKVWWKCSKGHEWQAQINDRNRGNNCPYCSKKKQNSK